MARERELAAVVDAVHGAAGAVVVGEAGVGKTLLANVVAGQVGDRGDEVVWVLATAASRPMPFGALAVLLTDEMTTLHPALVFGHVARRLRQLGGRRPPLLVIDDAHMLDNESAATVLALVTSGTVRVLATVRSDEPVPDAVVALWKDGFVRMVEVRPFDRAATDALLASLLGGEIATTTAHQLWQVTQGNPLYLAELVRYGRSEGRLVDGDGVWIWRGDLGDLGVPPRLGDLLDRHLRELSPAGLDALGAVAMAEPLPFDTLAAVLPADGIAEVEDRGLVRAERRDGTTWVGVTHPLVAEAAKGHLTTLRRRRVADALVAAGPERLDPVRLASLQLDASGEPDVDRLVAGARAVLLSQPALALRFAERAAASSAGPKALVMMADAYAELGRPDEAERAHRRATAAVRTARDHLTVRMSELSFLTWTRRRPHEALDQLAALRATVPADDGPWVESTIALVTLFTARPAAALERAEAVLAGDPAPPRLDRIRASIVRLGALAMTGRTVDAVAASSELLAELDAGDVPPRTFGMGHVMAGLVGFIAWRDHVTRADPMSRWPVPPSDLARPGDAVRWPLLEGARRLVEGNVGVAVPLLREAAAQQRVGEGPFRSEAISQLIRGLVAAGHLDEAERLLADEPPDEVAVYPGLVSSCRAAIEAARGRPSAVDHAIAAAEQAEAVGAVVAAVAYAAEAARYGGVARAMAVIERLGDDFEVRPTSARAFAVRALAAGDPKALLDAAERYAAVGVWADAAALADSAAAGLRRDASGARARAVLLAQECRDKLGLASQAARAADALTRRELEVARLAVTGMSDRAIAETLVVSVRTAESHVAAIYRKLGITSRRALRELLAPQ